MPMRISRGPSSASSSSSLLLPLLMSSSSSSVVLLPSYSIPSSPFLPGVRADRRVSPTSLPPQLRLPPTHRTPATLAPLAALARGEISRQARARFTAVVALIGVLLAAATAPHNPATPLSPASKGASPALPFAKIRTIGPAILSGMVRKSLAASASTSQANSDGSPQDRPAMTVSSSIDTLVAALA